MGKYANKPKGKPSKRKTFKVKYKIQRKVKQHNKRVKKEARKLRGKGLKHKGIARSDFLPNMFPFKQQILDQARKDLPQEKQTTLQILSSSEFGLINIENKCAYLPKPKDNLIKKYVTDLQHLLSSVHIVLELLDAKNPKDCIDEQFRQKLRLKKVAVVTVLTKTDTVSPQQLQKAVQIAKSAKSSAVVLFSSDHKLRDKGIEQLTNQLKKLPPGQILVAGKTLTGKHSLITWLAKSSGKYQQNPCELQTFKLDNGFTLIDSPYKIVDNTENPMFTVPNPVLEESLQAQEERLIRKLFVGQNAEKPLFQRNLVVENYQIQDFSSVTDFVAKVGKAGKHFGKGGSIDTARVRNKIVSDWFTGKLNKLMEKSQ